MRVERAAIRPTTDAVVSVVVPCYNYGRFLPDAVASVLSQGVPVEVIIVDDCSTDDSAAIGSAMVRRDARLRLVRNAENLGHIATYNKGLAMVSGDYVVLLSADDMLAPGSLVRAVSLFERHRSVGLVYGYAAPFTDVAPPVWDTRTWTVWRGPEWVDRVCRRGDNVIFNPEAIMRTSLLRSLGGGYEPSSPHAADMLLWLRAGLMADVGRVNRVQGYYRTHAAQMHVTAHAGQIHDMDARAAVYRSLFGAGGIAPDAARLGAALRSIEHEAAWLADRALRSGDEAARDEYMRVGGRGAADRRSSMLWRLSTVARGEIAGRLAAGAYAARWKFKSRRWRWLGY